jgi:hypothetical protein
VQQLRAQGLLQCGDLPADIGLTDPELTPDSREAAGFDRPDKTGHRT